MHKWTFRGKSSKTIEITEEFADAVAEQYFLCERDRRRMGFALGLERILDEFYLHDPRIRQRINERAAEMSSKGLYSHQEHIEKLKEIRDKAMEGIAIENASGETEVLVEPDLGLTLKAEIALGKAAGLYENLGAPPEDNVPETPPEKLSTDEIRKRLQSLKSNQIADSSSAMKTVQEVGKPDENGAF